MGDSPPCTPYPPSLDGQPFVGVQLLVDDRERASCIEALVQKILDGDVAGGEWIRELETVSARLREMVNEQNYMKVDLNEYEWDYCTQLSSQHRVQSTVDTCFMLETKPMLKDVLIEFERLECALAAVRRATAKLKEDLHELVENERMHKRRRCITIDELVEAGCVC